jgi:hypothetical protein
MKYYVYELVDPRTSRVFYVGKGRGKRMHAHEREAIIRREIKPEFLAPIFAKYGIGVV